MAIGSKNYPPIRRINAKEGSDAAYQILRDHGCVVVEQIISPNIITKINSDVDRVMHKGTILLSQSHKGRRRL
jgi:hypothetical protein